MSAGPAGDRHLTADELAERIGKSRLWVIRNKAQLPHLKIGRDIRFTEKHVEEIEASFEVRPKPASTVPAGMSPRAARYRERRRRGT